jgi:hypothetical protein
MKWISVKDKENIVFVPESTAIINVVYYDYERKTFIEEINNELHILQRTVLVAYLDIR